MPKVLNVGGGNNRELPPAFKGWEQDLLDIDPGVSPDILCDARKIHTLRTRYDGIYCSHTLEHFYRHEVHGVLSGFAHVLRPRGFVYLAVPDLSKLFAAVANGDVMDTWYRCDAGPISFHDVLYGWNRQMEQGNLFYAHKCGFTEKSLTAALRYAGFRTITTATDGLSLHAYGFKSKASAETLRRLCL